MSYETYRLGISNLAQDEASGEDISEGVAEEGRDYLKSKGYSADIDIMDVTNTDQVRASAEKMAKQGGIDILVGNAGVNPFHGPMSDISDEAFDKIMSTNVKANHWLAQMVAPDMVAKGAGSMMFTSSTGAFSASVALGAYSISKLALIGLARNLAAELGPKGVRANAICPGLVRTDFAQALWDNPEAEQRANEQIPLRRLGEADDLKGLTVFLAGLVVAGFVAIPIVNLATPLFATAFMVHIVKRMREDAVV